MSTITQKIKVPVAELKTGMYVCELDRPWGESPFAFQGFPLRSDDEIQAVRDCCVYVYVDPKKSSGWTYRPGAAPGEAAAAGPATVHRAPTRRRSPTDWLRGVLPRRRGHSQVGREVAHRLDVAERSYGEVTRLVRTVMADVRLGRSLDMGSVKETVGLCVEQITRDSDAMLLLGSIKSKDDYTAQHGLNVSIFSMILGHRLGMSQVRLRELGVCSLLHDVGKILIPDEILKKPGRLTDSEFAHMRQHTVYGRDVLLGCEGSVRAAVEVAHNHHERLDGSGYPRGLTEAETDLYSKIVAVTDTFDAITSDRVYGAGRTTIEAFKILRSASGNSYDARLVSEFISALGIYPPGSVVQLNNGEYGVVVRANRRHEVRPLVMVVKDATQREVRPRYVDLASAADRTGRPIQIAKMLRGEDCGIHNAMFRNQRFLETATG
ncbi:MAG: HD-GYP domain-containing protein [Chromatiaceae bacterium]|jgi:HD-GYP domain-containing protein (c-di-GMP phosphodiesterase class II)|nr:HD-GYP domain-containing protein [Chromatiaceae bacterium]